MQVFVSEAVIAGFFILTQKKKSCQLMQTFVFQPVTSARFLSLVQKKKKEIVLANSKFCFSSQSEAFHFMESFSPAFVIIEKSLTVPLKITCSKQGKNTHKLSLHFI